MVSVAEPLRPTNSEPTEVAGDEQAFGEVAAIPPRVEYEFTSRGRSMLGVVRAAGRYAEDARER